MSTYQHKSTAFPQIINIPLVPTTAGMRPLCIAEVVTLTHQYCEEYNQDCETALSYVLAGTDRHDVNPGPTDTFSTVVWTPAGYVWKHDNKPEPETEQEDYCQADARIDYYENFRD